MTARPQGDFSGELTIPKEMPARRLEQRTERSVSSEVPDQEPRGESRSRFEHCIAIFREGYAVPTGNLDVRDPKGQPTLKQFGEQGWHAIAMTQGPDGSMRMLFGREILNR